jgi:hypothetical protein
MSLVLIISAGWALTALAFGVLARAIGTVAARADAVSDASAEAAGAEARPRP